MTIGTLTLNPALDRTMYFGEPFMPGALNRANESVTTLGSKGINVSRVFGRLGVDAVAYAFSGGDNGRVMKFMLEREGVPYRFVETAAQTRMNIKLIDCDGVCTEANESGGPITSDELDRLLAALSDAAENTQLFALGGSIPPPVEKSVYKAITTMLKKKGVRVLLDCDKEALRLGLEAQPELIKPNLFELSQLIGHTPASAEETALECRRLFVDTGVRVLCTMGDAGALYAGSEGVWTVGSPQVTLRGFTGAGDTFLAAFIYMHESSGDLCRALRFASSAAAAKVTLPGSQIPERASMDKYMDSLMTQKID